MNRILTVSVAWLVLGASWSAAGMPNTASDDLQAMVKADWTAQEARLGRTPFQPGTLQQRPTSAGRLLEHLRAMPDAGDFADEAVQLGRLRREIAQANRLDDAARRDLYLSVRGVTRALVLKNPLLARRPILLLKQRRFICQMSGIPRCWATGESFTPVGITWTARRRTSMASG
jgi:hypothetical protein